MTFQRRLCLGLKKPFRVPNHHAFRFFQRFGQLLRLRALALGVQIEDEKIVANKT